jgi:hypothetical protein
MTGGACVQTIGYLLEDRSFDRISKAFLKGGKSGLPIRFARFSMPFAAFGLKKYLNGTSPVSITPNNVDSTA